MVLGLLLVLLSGAAVVLLAFYNRSGGPDYSVNLFDREIYVANTLSIFLAGVTLALLFSIGLWMMSAAARRSRARRAEVRAARQDARTAEAERDRLAGQVGDEHRAHYEDVSRDRTAPAPAYATGDEHGRRRFFNRRHEDQPTTPTTTAP